MERPMLFSKPMVNAIGEGRKTQTRRLFVGTTEHREPYNPCYMDAHRGSPGWKSICPYGNIGDVLWVKETWRPTIQSNGSVRIEYAADGGWRTRPAELITGGWRIPKAAATGNVSPLFMPRWASRLSLMITDIRVQQLQDINVADCLAEGVEKRTFGLWWNGGTALTDERNPVFKKAGALKDARANYAMLWESLHGYGSWFINPWVWAISFERVKP